MSEVILQVRQLCKNFGGLAAVDQVSFEVKPGELHAIIGPNGAGKTTLINLLSGDLSPSSGSIFFRGSEISALAPERRSRLGIGRSYQKTNIFPGFSALENCRLAAQAREPRALSWFRNALSYDSVVTQARDSLDAVGLADRANELAYALSHGAQRQLELAMCLATQPQLLLLDEPLAGIAASHAVLLVEHDMDAVFQLAKVLTVMVNGKVLASGTPAAIRASHEVQTAYLGRTDEP